MGLLCRECVGINISLYGDFIVSVEGWNCRDIFCILLVVKDGK